MFVLANTVRSTSGSDRRLTVTVSSRPSSRLRAAAWLIPATGGYTIVKDAVRQAKRQMKEVYMPLIHRPGEAQVDFGHAVVKMSGVCGRSASS